MNPAISQMFSQQILLTQRYLLAHCKFSGGLPLMEPGVSLLAFDSTII
jgi:hypothetical protein